MGIENLDTKLELGRWMVEFFEGEPLEMSSVEGLQQALTPGKWEPLSLLNGWTNYGGGFAQAAYRTTPGGGFQVRGVVTKALEPNGTTICQLPAASRPASGHIFDASSEAIDARLNLLTDGSLVFVGIEAPYVSLSAVIFWPGS
jgi:hypothetical protein